MKKKFAIFTIATFSVLGLCLSAVAAPLTAEEREQRRAEFKNMTPEEKTAKQEEIRSQREENREERKERMEERKENREERREQRCENAGKRIETRIKRYENNQEQHRNVFGRLVTRVESVRDKLTEAGLDTTKLSADIETLKEKVKELEVEHQEFIAGLKATESYECGASDGQFREKLGEARKMSSEVRTKLVDIRNYYQTVVRPDIIELREQLEDDSTDTE